MSRNNSRKGVVCHLSLEPDGKVRLVLDDVATEEGAANPLQWTRHVPFTSTLYSERAFLNVALSESELADIGLAIVSRLAAFDSKSSPDRDK